MNKSILIVGGGLSGLSAAWQLHRHGVNVRLLEARQRIGGRVLSLNVRESRFDCGPSWIWHGQPHVAGILNHFKISVYGQVCDGDLLHQMPDGSIHRDPVVKPMQGALRVQGSASAITEALQSELPDDIVHCNCAVSSLAVGDDGVTITTEDGESFAADRVAIAIPLRLAAGITFTPPLDAHSIDLMKSTPTWMSGQAKVFAFYEKPFWREQGLSGDVFSRSGPIAEIHDATTDVSGPFALMGFVGIDGPARDVMTSAGLLNAVKNQLVALFGEQAGAPTKMHLMDWSLEPFTAASGDRRSPNHHPHYGIQIQPPSPWSDAIQFIVSETARENGGLVEGALQQGLGYACEVIQAHQKSVDQPMVDCNPDPHAATMSWDWIGPN